MALTDNYPNSIESPQRLFVQYSQDITFDYSTGRYPIGTEVGFIWEDYYNPVTHIINQTIIKPHVWRREKLGTKGDWSLPQPIGLTSNSIEEFTTSIINTLQTTNPIYIEDGVIKHLDTEGYNHLPIGGTIGQLLSKTSDGYQWINTSTFINESYSKTELNNGVLNFLYYTEVELDAGQLDNRYYTEIEIDNFLSNYYTSTEINDLLIFDVLVFNTGYVSTGSESLGNTYWDSDNNTLSTVLEGGVIGQHFEETFIIGQNDTGILISNGTVATYLDSIGSSGNIRVGGTLASTTEPSYMTLGLFTETVANGATGRITTYGKVRGIQTDGANYGEVWNNKDIVYKSPTIAGGLTNIAPQAPIPAIPIGVILAAHSSNGTILVRPTFPTALTELTDVNGTPLTNSGQVPIWNNITKVFDFTANINDYYTQTELQTSGTANVHWDNITNVPPLVPAPEWEIYFDDVLSECEIILETDTTITSIVLGKAVTVEYSIDDGLTWIPYTIPVLLTAGYVKWRVSDFGIYSDGSIIIKT